MSKKHYKQLKKGLKNEYSNTSRDYALRGAVGDWLVQSGISPHSNHLTIICGIFGSHPYVHQEKDRRKIIKYLKKHSYKEYKNDNNIKD